MEDPVWLNSLRILFCCLRYSSGSYFDKTYDNIEDFLQASNHGLRSKLPSYTHSYRDTVAETWKAWIEDPRSGIKELRSKQGTEGIPAPRCRHEKTMSERLKRFFTIICYSKPIPDVYSYIYFCLLIDYYQEELDCSPNGIAALMKLQVFRVRNKPLTTSKIREIFEARGLANDLGNISVIYLSEWNFVLLIDNLTILYPKKLKEISRLIKHTQWLGNFCYLIVLRSAETISEDLFELLIKNFLLPKKISQFLEYLELIAKKNNPERYHFFLDRFLEYYGPSILSNYLLDKILLKKSDVELLYQFPQLRPVICLILEMHLGKKCPDLEVLASKYGNKASNYSLLFERFKEELNSEG